MDKKDKPVNFNQFLKKNNIKFKIKNNKQLTIVKNPLDILNVRYQVKNNKVTIFGNFNPTQLFLDALNNQPIYIQKVAGDVTIKELRITDLSLFNFEQVKGDFYCRYNNLTSLQGAPSTVGGDFSCSYNKLTSLQGAPRSVGGDFRCSYNKLTSLQGAPSSVGGDFSCDNNNLTSLQGAPSSVGGGFSCDNNNKTFTQQQVKQICKVSGRIAV